jgi:hypothetical protein
LTKKGLGYIRANFSQTHLVSLVTKNSFGGLVSPLRFLGLELATAWKPNWGQFNETVLAEIYRYNLRSAVCKNINILF